VNSTEKHRQINKIAVNVHRIIINNIHTSHKLYSHISQNDIHAFHKTSSAHRTKQDNIHPANGQIDVDGTNPLVSGAPPTVSLVRALAINADCEQRPMSCLDKCLSETTSPTRLNYPRPFPTGAPRRGLRWLCECALWRRYENVTTGLIDESTIKIFTAVGRLAWLTWAATPSTPSARHAHLCRCSQHGMGRGSTASNSTLQQRHFFVIMRGHCIWFVTCLHT